MRLLIVLLLSALPLSAQTLKIFLLTGQSNSLGTLADTDTTMARTAAGAHPTDAQIPFYWDNRADGTEAGNTALGNSGGWTTISSQTGGYYPNNDDHWGPEVGFARMLWNAGLRDFAIVKASRGGGGNSFWVKGSADDHMYDHLLATAQAAVASLPAGYTGHEFAGLLYLQGESNDATEADEADVRFEALLTNLETDLPAASPLAGVFGEIGGSASTNRITTRTRQSSLAASRSDIGYASAAGTSMHDGLHYDADSSLLLGERMAAEMLNTGATGLAPLPAPGDLYAWYVADHGIRPDSSGSVVRWSNLKDGSANADLTRSVTNFPEVRTATAGNGDAREVMVFDGGADIWASSGEFGPLDHGRSVALLCRVPGGEDGFLFDGSTFSGRTRAQVNGDNWQAGVSTSTWDAPDTTTTPRTLSTWQRHVFTFSETSSTTEVEHWIDGTLVGNHTDNEVAALRGLIVGSNGGSPFDRLPVEIAEIAIYEKTLSATEIATLDTAWQTRWGSPSGPPFAIRVGQNPATISRFGHHPLLHIEIDSPDNSESLTSLTLNFKDNSRERVGLLRLLQTGTDGQFLASAETLGDITPGTDAVTFDFNHPLAEGTNHLWLAIEPERHAAIGSTIDASLTSLTLSGTGTHTPDGDPAGELTVGLVPYFSDVRRSNDFGITTYRIPGIAADDEGVLHAVFDHRWNGGSDLPANVDVGYSRSTDGGATWSGFQPIMDLDASVPGSAGNGVGDPAILWDPVTDTLWVAALWSFGNNGWAGSGPGTDPVDTGQYVLTKSTDGGDTWSDLINITVAVKDDPNWRLIFQGPGHGLAMRDGTLVFPSQYRDASGVSRVCSVYSTDHGETWDFGSGVPTSSPQTNENTACELDDGRLLFSMRTPSGSNGQRAWIHYTPGGTEPMRDGSWNNLFRLASVPDPVCQGSVIQWTSTHTGSPREKIAFINPGSSSSRVNLTLRVSGDGGASWPVSRLVYGGPSAYSSLCVLPDKSLGMLFEKDNYTRITFVRVEEDWLWNPDNDGDGDGLPDNWEIFHETNPSQADGDADPDGDGQSNLQEYRAGTDPLVTASLFEIDSFTPAENGWLLTWHSVPGRAYVVETSPDLDDWTASEELIAADSSLSQELPGGSGRLFARVRIR